MNKSIETELVENAALACGYKIEGWYSNDDSHRLKLHVLEDGVYPVIYEPLNDSENALETAARLEIQVEYAGNKVYATRKSLQGAAATGNPTAIIEYTPGDLHDKMRAVRLAITSCASHFAEKSQYVQYDAADISRRERSLHDQGYEVKVDVSGGFWVVTDGLDTYIGTSKAEAIMSYYEESNESR